MRLLNARNCVCLFACGVTACVTLNLWIQTFSVQDQLDWRATSKKSFFLSSVIMVRIYRKDLARWTVKELKQWLHYLLYAGVEHVYLCDHFVNYHEQLKPTLRKYTKKGILTYINWPWNASANDGEIMRHQKNCYTYVKNKYDYMSEWQLSIDMDEYPFCPYDMERQFLTRYLEDQPDVVSQILMPNFFMLGQGNRSKTMLTERITRITKTIANDLTKPLYRPAAVRTVGIHRHQLKSGSTVSANSKTLRMLHYWGARKQKWGPDTNKTFETTNEYDFVRDNIAPVVRNDLIAFGESDVFSSATGP